jgi:hypothetical protein
MTGRKRTVFLIIIFILLALIIFAVAFLIDFVNEFRKSSTSQKPPIETVQPPCTSNSKTLALGRPTTDREVAFFKTDGGDLYFTAKGFIKGGFFDPKVGITALYIGRQDLLPTYNEQSNSVSNKLVELTVREGKYVKYSLPHGLYWLWTSNGAEIFVASCGNISN